MEVTKREILISTIIGAIILSIAILLFSVVQDKFFDTKTAFENSLKIDNNADLMNHAIDTKVGSVLVTGTLAGVNPVTFTEIKGDFIRIIKTKERYTMHTRVVTYKCGESTCTRTETYWTWDYAGEEEKAVTEVSFLGRNYNYSLFSFYPENNLSLSSKNTNTKHKVRNNYIYESSHVRYYYEVVPSSFSTTIFVTTKMGALSPYSGNKISLYPYKNIEETIKLQDTYYIIVSIVYWVIIIGMGAFVIYKYVEMENNYLEK